MKREVVQDFLNLPGIAGVALMNGRSRPYFHGVDQTLNFQQKETLAQGIQQVVETTPTDFKFFEFQFTGYQVYIYKLEHGIILLVLAVDQLVQPGYLQAVERLKVELQADISNTIATFRLLAGNITLSNQSYWHQRPPSALSDDSKTSLAEARPDVQATSKTRVANGTQDLISPPFEQFDPVDSTGSSKDSTTPDSSKPDTVPQVNLTELLSALNQLSQFATQYLGTTVVNNYWRSSRPSAPWLNNFEVNRMATITYSSSDPSDLAQVLTPDQHQCIQQWVAAFLERCSKVIRDFTLIIQQSALDDCQKRILLPNNS